jgi:RNA polymerase sigma-70 factor (ECF subfamily)
MLSPGFKQINPGLPMTDHSNASQQKINTGTDPSEATAGVPEATLQRIADFIQEHRGELSRFIVRKAGSEDQALDTLHDAFLRINGQQSPETVENLRAYVFRTVANLVIDFQRRCHNRLPHEVDEKTWQNIPDHLPGPESRYQQRQRLEAVNRALAELPEACRSAFYLNRIEGCSHAEIAARLNLSESMVAKHLARAMQHCRDCLKNY